MGSGCISKRTGGSECVAPTGASGQWRQGSGAAAGAAGQRQRLASAGEGRAEQMSTGAGERGQPFEWRLQSKDQEMKKKKKKTSR